MGSIVRSHIRSALGLAPERRRILIVEDDREMGRCIRQCLADEGYDVRLECNGADAAKCLTHRQFRPDLVLLDLLMPEMNGMDFLTTQMNKGPLANVPVVALSADHRAIDRVKNLGVVASFEKPLRLSELIDTVKVYCPIQDRSV